jgi:hypothetical protein
MSAPRSVWLDVLDWLEAIGLAAAGYLPSGTSFRGICGFLVSARHSSKCPAGHELSKKIRSLIAGEVPSLTALEAWLYRRRVEWAMQVALAKVKQGIEPGRSAVRGPDLDLGFVLGNRRLYWILEPR